MGTFRYDGMPLTKPFLYNCCTFFFSSSSFCKLENLLVCRTGVYRPAPRALESSSIVDVKGFRIYVHMHLDSQRAGTYASNLPGYLFLFLIYLLIFLFQFFFNIPFFSTTGHVSSQGSIVPCITMIQTFALERVPRPL